MNPVHSSSWEPNFNSNDNPYLSDNTTSLPPLPKINADQTEPAQAHDVSLSNLLPEFFEDGTAPTQPLPQNETLYDYGAVAAPISTEPTARNTKPEQANKAPVTVDTNRMYAWLEQQEHQEERQHVNRERQQLWLKIGAVTVVVALIAAFLILNVLTPAPVPPKVVIAGELSPYPAATRVEVPAKLNQDVHEAFLLTQKPAPTSAETYYFLTSDPATKILEFYNQDMAGKGFVKPVLIDDFLKTAPSTKALNARGVSYTNATPQGYAVVAVPVTSALVTGLGSSAKAGDILLVLLSIKS